MARSNAGRCNSRTGLGKLTGQSWQDAVNAAKERADVYERASDEERKILDYEDRFKSYDQQFKKFQEENTRLKQEAKQKEFNAEVKYLQSLAEPVFLESVSQIDTGNEHMDNRLRKMIWRSSISDLKEMRTVGQDPSPQLIRKIFTENATAVIGSYQSKVDSKVQEAIADKKATASQKAQEASTVNYDVDSRELGSLDPLALFNKFRK